ncbi:MAG: hypothetical protein JO112_12315, partial [Planctomycetes bacterium]|nr:hypothetical protein [Planctomycetota bacterium]
QDLASFRHRLETTKQGTAPLQTLLHVAGGWYYFGREDLARPVLQEARSLLLEGSLSPHEQKPLACTYVTVLGQAPMEFALPRFEELFHKLERVHDAFTTNSHYALSKLMFVEAVVLALVSDDFVVGTEVRRWLDDDEYLVRRRIHRDVRTLMAQAGL